MRKIIRSLRFNLQSIHKDLKLENIYLESRVSLRRFLKSPIKTFLQIRERREKSTGQKLKNISFKTGRGFFGRVCLPAIKEIKKDETLSLYTKWAE